MKQLTLLLLFVCQITFGQTPELPVKTNNYVNDYSNVLNDQDEASLREVCKSIELESSSQVVIVTLDKLPEGYNIEDYSVLLAQTWGIGQDKVDNGVLIIVLPLLRQSRIEVGYGLEGLLTDAFTKRLQVNNFRPNFKAGDYYTGLLKSLVDIKNGIKPEAQEQKRLNDLEQERKQAVATQAVLNFLKWCFFLGLIATALYFIIRHYTKEKREKEEAERRAAEMKRIQEARIQQEKMNIERSIKGAFEKFNKVYEENIKLLASMNGFMDSNELIKQVSTFCNEARKLAFALPEKDQTAHYRSLESFVITSMDRIKKDFKVYSDVLNEFDNFKSSKAQMQKLHDDANAALKELETYPDEIWENRKPALVSNFDVYYQSLFRKFEFSVQLVMNNNFKDATDANNFLLKEIHLFNAACLAATSRLGSLKTALFYVKNANTLFEKSLKDTDKVVDNFYVSLKLKNEWRQMKPLLVINFKPNIHALNPFTEMNTWKEVLDDIDSFKKRAQAEITDEEARIAKKKKDNDDAERKRKKKKPDDDDNITRNNNVVIFSSNDSSSSSSSSSDTSFGGGDFGGGGSSDNW